ncbi:MAG: cytochrome c [Rhodobacter sp.]|nr:cytochrome c [Rhodobacter sp.]
MTNELLLSIRSLATGAVLVAGAVQADPVGERLYLNFCAECHGRSGEGRSPSGGVAGPSGPPLTDLSAQNGGRFPTEQVIRSIDGRYRIPSHLGGMPAWRREFQVIAGTTPSALDDAGEPLFRWSSESSDGDCPPSDGASDLSEQSDTDRFGGSRGRDCSPRLVERTDRDALDPETLQSQQDAREGTSEAWVLSITRFIETLQR